MDKPLSLVEHLEELRKRIIICVVSLAVGILVGFPFSSPILKILKLPAKGLIEKLVFFSPQEAFLIYMNIALFSGLVISLPVILYQFWAFVLPAVEEKLRKYIGFFLFFCLIFFISGCLFAYFVLIPPSLKFLLGFASGELEPVICASKYISFLLSLILGCGVVFQMPVLSFLLSKIGIINAKILRKKYKYALVMIFIIAAAITPTTDIFNMLALAVPMLLLYEISIWISFLAANKQKVKE
ncbi:MAG: twin-arginine translocase subunit TatC [Candidatus Omnitrophota bacterium]|nr:twin-arginine translocase subunit TatC [Candidatus Omnitrophota bacterium]